MLTKKDILKIAALIIAAIGIVWLILWIISKIVPLLIGAIVFFPWLFAALADGGNV